jgi:outer membrane biosynthesis protein TonB
MNLAKEHDRKGLVATILIHLIVLLLLMMVIPEIKESMMDDAGMVQVSFGELDGGGPENTNSVSEPQSNPEPTQQQSNPTPNPTPTPDNPVVTNDDAEAEVKNDAPKQTQKTQEEKEVEKEAPKVNDRLKDRLDALKNRQKTGDDNSSSGPGKDGPKGDPNSDKSGPGGNDPTGNDNTGGGRYGSNINHSLFGFGIESAPKFQTHEQTRLCNRRIVC